MIIGILKETKLGENRVSMTPEGVEVITQHGAYCSRGARSRAGQRLPG